MRLTAVATLILLEWTRRMVLRQVDLVLLFARRIADKLELASALLACQGCAAICGGRPQRRKQIVSNASASRKLEKVVSDGYSAISQRHRLS
jgi:hypothetical protein